MNYNLIKLLKQASAINITPSNETDTKIREIIYNSEISPYSRWNTFLKPAFAIVVVFLILIIVRNIFYPAYIYNNVMSTIMEIQREKDVNKALSLYSDEFFYILSKEKFKNNIKTLFTYYNKIKYIPEKYKVILKKNTLLIENIVYYEAYPKSKKFAQIVYKGRERIYFKKEDDKWRIVAWIYDI